MTLDKQEMDMIARLTRERDEARAEVERVRECLLEALAEEAQTRDAARAEVARLAESRDWQTQQTIEAQQEAVRYSHERDEAREALTKLRAGRMGLVCEAVAAAAIACAREEQREACAQWSGASRVLKDLVRTTPLDSTPLADALREALGFLDLIPNCGCAMDEEQSADLPCMWCEKRCATIRLLQKALGES